MLMSMSSKSDEAKYSEVMGHFDALEVSEFQLDLGSGELKYKLKDAPDEEKNYKVPNVSLFVSEVLGGEEAVNYRKQYDAATLDLINQTASE